MSETHKKVLEVLTYIGCALSLFGIFGVFATAIIIRQWRERDGSTIIINICLSTCAFIMLFLISDFVSRSNIANIPCIILGATLHYSMLVSFFLTLLASNCQYRRYVAVFASAFTDNFKFKLYACGWGTPAFIVVVSLVLDANAYLPHQHFIGDICYPNGWILWVGVHIPLICIIFVNLVIYFLIVFHLNFKSTGVGKTSSSSKSNLMNQLRLFFYMFFLLSIMWGSGFISYYTDILFFSYVFICTATIQGFIIFCYCIVLDPKTRRHWLIYLNCSKFTKPDVSYLHSTVTNQ